MSDHTHAILDREGDHATVTIHTEKGLNVGSVEFVGELEAVVDELAQDRGVRFVILRAEGRVFLAGANIKAMAEYDAGQARDMAELGHRVFNKIESLPQVTVAAIHGAALGGGCELAMACDFRVAVKSAPIGQPEVLLGLIPGWGGTIRLPRLVPLGAAKRLLFSGDGIKAEEAKCLGLVDEIVNSEEDLAPFINAFLDRMVRAGPEAVAILKQALHSGREIDGFVSCFDGRESREGMTAFLEKRPASWTHQK